VGSAFGILVAMDSEEPAKPLRPAPVLTDDNEGFWLAAQDGRLSIQRCQECGRFNHPPRPMCPNCHSLDLVWEEVSGVGEVYSYALLHHPQHPAFAYPVRAVLVDLEEGVRVVSNVIDVAPEEIYIGMPVTVAFEPTVDEFAVPVFRPRPRKA
jgi:uncharacterized OB-fold protein